MDTMHPTAVRRLYLVWQPRACKPPMLVLGSLDKREALAVENYGYRGRYLQVIDDPSPEDVQRYCARNAAPWIRPFKA